MMQEQIDKMMEDNYDMSSGETLREMIGVFYGKRMRTIAIIVWFWGLLFMALIIFAAIKFAYSADTKMQIMYAAFFVSGWIGIGVCKEMAWSMINKNLLGREIKRLELRIAELSKIVKEQ